MDESNPIQQVEVRNFDMSFGRMVVFMVKWAFAAIPAMLILLGVGYAAVSIINVVSDIDLDQPMASDISVPEAKETMPDVDEVTNPVVAREKVALRECQDLIRVRLRDGYSAAFSEKYSVLVTTGSQITLKSTVHRMDVLNRMVSTSWECTARDNGGSWTVVSITGA